MKAYNALEWIDTLICDEMNPAWGAKEPLQHEVIANFKDRIEVEQRNIITRLKQLIFKQDEVGGMIKKYHDSLVLIIGKNFDLQQERKKRKDLYELHQFIGHRLEETLMIFEREFSAFLSEENRMPLTRLIPLKAKIEENRELMAAKLSTGDHGPEPVTIVLEVFDDFTGKIDKRLPVSIREASYISELITDVLNLAEEGSGITSCPQLNELLIYWNLNSKSCIRYFTLGVEYMLESCEGAKEKLEFLLLEDKKLQAIPEKQNFILNPEFPSVKTYCSQWLSNEIKYRKWRQEGFIPLTPAEAKQNMKDRNFKVMVGLSIDQIALILRGAEESRVLKARSKSAVYKAISPYISTPVTENINWDNLRTKSYVAEETDKAAAIEVLEGVIEKIKEF